MPILDQIKSADKVLILGFGREGQSTLNFLKRKFPRLRIDTADLKDGPDYLAKIANYQIIIKTPGISPHLPEIATAKKTKRLITSQTQIFFELCPGKIIGVTGTKGKSTTASLIYHVLHENHIPALLVGNIGKPALDFLPEIAPVTWVVMELSSYQLMDLTISPHIAVLQAIYPDHLDYHQDLKEYKNSKLNITKYQTKDDYLICFESHKDVNTKAQKVVFSLSDYDPEIKTTVLGNHNKLNIVPSLIIGKLLGLSKKQIYPTITSFQSLETRLENCGTHKGITFYADTLATIPEATIAAINTLGPATLIAGGHERHQDYGQLAQRIISSKITTLILFPTTGPRIWEEIVKLQPSSQIKHFQASSMEQAVKLSFTHTPPNSICLLSPAAPSFTLFKNYRDEHEQYKSAIASLTTSIKS